MAHNDDEPDFFDGPDIEEKPKETPSPNEEDEKDEDTIVVGRSRSKTILTYLVAAFVLGILIWGYLRYFHPYISEAQRTGYIIQVDKRGTFFKTYEGEMLPTEAIKDTLRLYQGSFAFSFDNDSIAKKVMSLQGSGKKVTLKYKEYGGVLPWRGAQKAVAIGVEE